MSSVRFGHTPSKYPRLCYPVNRQPSNQQHQISQEIQGFWRQEGIWRSPQRMGRYAGRGTRTPDPLITNQVHYQLCYAGAEPPFYRSEPLKAPWPSP